MAKAIKRKQLGWRPDTPDMRDKVFKMPKKSSIDLPKKVDLREFCPPIYDQGDLGSCVAHAVSAALLFNNKVTETHADFTPSRLWIYYQARAIENVIREDSGCEIRDAIKVVSKLGAPHEKLWPYNVKTFTKKPKPSVVKAAGSYKALVYKRLNNENIDELKLTLRKCRPIVFGATLYVGCEKSYTNGGKIAYPKKSDKVDGGHAMLIVGYNDATKQFLIQNSWGTDVGDKGYFYMPYKYITDKNLCDDFWGIDVVST